MLDVARHFLPPDAVKRYVDLMALYKLNRLHLHLSDDQGWRIEIPAWPALTAVGGSTEVGGGPGGYYTREEYADLVRYASDRFITVVPEIDVPGHTNAALASYPALNCDGVAPPLFTGTAVGFSSLCVDKEETYAFLDDVVREIAALTPGPYFHIGGDEVRELSEEQYARFMDRAQQIVASHGKRVVGWDEVAETSLIPGTLVQVWRPQRSGSTSPALLDAVAGDATLILSPADRVYLDMKYDSTTVLGLHWAGYNDVRDAYDWEPTDLLPGVPGEAIAGVEAPLWSETLGTLADVEFMAFPRLVGVAEVAWSAEGSRDWSSYRLRLGAQAPRWTALGVNFFRSPLVPWIPMHDLPSEQPVP
jgi:hexosaminidase